MIPLSQGISQRHPLTKKPEDSGYEIDFGDYFQAHAQNCPMKEHKIRNLAILTYTEFGHLALLYCQGRPKQLHKGV